MLILLIQHNHANRSVSSEVMLSDMTALSIALLCCDISRVVGIALGSLSVYVPSKINLCSGNSIALKCQDFGVSALSTIRML
jgi:hypothetical protein